MWNKQPTKHRFVAYASICYSIYIFCFANIQYIYFLMKGNLSAVWKIDQNLIIIKTPQTLTYQANKEERKHTQSLQKLLNSWKFGTQYVILRLF